ncbi:MAG: BON domain-containing protein [Dehalococcoidia bacterium]|nr:BON domain-containing protein [Dehalococcoidia bacterium]
MDMSLRAREMRGGRRRYMRMVDRQLPAFPLRARRTQRRSWFQRQRMAVQLGLVAAIAMSTGAAFAMIFDPTAGRRRRALARDKMAKAWHRGNKRAGRMSRAGVGFVRGRAQRAFHAMRPRHYDSSDQVVVDRLESMVFRDPDVPKGSLNIDVVDGCAVLRGAVTSPYWIREMERRVLEVPGVQRVENLMHMVGTEAPNKMEAIEASEQGWKDRAMPRTY